MQTLAVNRRYALGDAASLEVLRSREIRSTAWLLLLTFCTQMGYSYNRSQAILQFARDTR